MLSLVALKDRKGVNERNKINTKSPDGAVSDEGGSAFSSNCRNNRHGSFSSLEVIVTIVHFFLHGNGESESVPKLSPLTHSLTHSLHSAYHSLSPITHSVTHSVTHSLKSSLLHHHQLATRNSNIHSIYY
jgi:hypothetical protein